MEFEENFLLELLLSIEIYSKNILWVQHEMNKIIMTRKFLT